MSRQLINEYRAELDRLRQISGSRRESVLREAFKDLLKRWGKSHDLQFVAEHDLLTRQMTRIYVDGALLHGLRVPFGYWEAKDENDDLDAEIEAALLDPKWRGTIAEHLPNGVVERREESSVV